jgi:hypothetical protein
LKDIEHHLIDLGDCCAPSCAQFGVNVCNKNNKPLAKLGKSGCESGGDSFNCLDQSPFMSTENKKLAYGFAAVHIAGEDPNKSCCSCYKVTFEGGKSMILQVSSNH